MSRQGGLFKLCVKAALIGLGLAVLASGLQALRAGCDWGGEPSLRATMIAACISEFVGCAIFYALIAVPVAIAVALIRRRRRPS